jgi:hypothetical protein
MLRFLHRIVASIANSIYGIGHNGTPCKNDSERVDSVIDSRLPHILGRTEAGTVDSSNHNKPAGAKQVLGLAALAADVY